MESIDVKPRFSGASIRGALKPWYVNIDWSIYTVSEELEALVKVSYSIQAINLESPNLLPEVSILILKLYMAHFLFIGIAASPA